MGNANVLFILAEGLDYHSPGMIIIIGSPGIFVCYLIAFKHAILQFQANPRYSSGLGFSALSP